MWVKDTKKKTDKWNRDTGNGWETDLNWVQDTNRRKTDSKWVNDTNREWEKDDSGCWDALTSPTTNMDYELALSLQAGIPRD